MNLSYLARLTCGLSLLAMIALLPVDASAAKRARVPKPKPGEFNPQHETVELFQAMKDKTLDVKIVMNDQAGGKVIIKNNTKKPLNIQLPEAFATVPVLAQIGGGGGGGQGGLIDFEEEREDRLESLTELLKQIQPQTWDDGGGLGTITAFSNQLVIRQTLEMHEVIGGRFAYTKDFYP